MPRTQERQPSQRGKVNDKVACSVRGRTGRVRVHDEHVRQVVQREQVAQEGGRIGVRDADVAGLRLQRRQHGRRVGADVDDEQRAKMRAVLRPARAHTRERFGNPRVHAVLWPACARSGGSEARPGQAIVVLT
jgi:hypothetical protein